MKLVLLRPDKAGDALKTLPVLRALVARRPQDEVHLVCSEHNASVFATEPGVHAHALPKSWKQMKSEKLLATLHAKGLPPKADRLINLLCDPFAETDSLLRGLPAQSKYSVAPLDATLATQLHLLTLPEATPAGRDETTNIALLVSQALGTDLASEVGLYSAAPRLLPADEHEALEIMGTKRGRWLGFCPFAGTTQRTHPLKRWERFLPKATRDVDFQKFFLFGTPSDYARLEKLRALCDRKEDVDLAFPSTFRTLGAFLKRLDGVVAVDSGPLHLALSLGVPSLGILSGGDTDRWFPRLGENDLLVRRGIFNRFPTVFEMHRAFRRWPPVMPIATPKIETSDTAELPA